MRFLLAFFILTNLSFAQAEQEAEQDDGKAFTGNAELSYILNTGNTESESFGTGLEINYELMNWEHELKGSYFRVESNDQTETRILRTNLFSSRKLAKYLSLKAALGFFSNKFAGIAERYTFDFGPQYDAIRTKRHKLKASAVGGLVEEQRTKGALFCL